jgi:hypothetical protein
MRLWPGGAAEDHVIGQPIALAARDVRIVDRLPPGFRYRPGSTRLDGQKIPDPEISVDGRTLIWRMESLRERERFNIRYVVEVAAGTPTGRAVNIAWAEAAGSARSNDATAEVLVVEDLFRSHSVISGRVIVTDCDSDPSNDPEGIANIRLFLEDGRYVVTDDAGRYHFAGVSSGTHVIQLDIDTLPEEFEPANCHNDSRSAGRAHSRFVDV